MPLKGVLGLHTYIYPHISPALPAGCRRLWLDSCGDLIQLWILMNPLLYDGRESRKLRTWPKSCKKSDVAAEDNCNQMSLGASASCLWGHEETFVTLEDKWPPVPRDLLLSLCFPTPKLRDWPQSEKSNQMGVAMQWHSGTIICLASIFSHFLPMPKQVQDREDFSSTYQET